MVEDEKAALEKAINRAKAVQEAMTKLSEELKKEKEE